MGSEYTRSTVSLLDQHEKNEHELHKQVAKSWRLNGEADTNKDNAIDDPEDSFSGFGSNPDGSHWTIKKSGGFIVGTMINGPALPPAEDVAFDSDAVNFSDMSTSSEETENASLAAEVNADGTMINGPALPPVEVVAFDSDAVKFSDMSTSSKETKHASLAAEVKADGSKEKKVNVLEPFLPLASSEEEEGTTDMEAGSDAGSDFSPEEVMKSAVNLNGELSREDKYTAGHTNTFLAYVIYDLRMVPSKKMWLNRRSLYEESAERLEHYRDGPHRFHDGNMWLHVTCAIRRVKLEKGSHTKYRVEYYRGLRQQDMHLEVTTVDWTLLAHVMTRAGWLLVRYVTSLGLTVTIPKTYYKSYFESRVMIKFRAAVGNLRDYVGREMCVGMDCDGNSFPITYDWLLHGSVPSRGRPAPGTPFVALFKQLQQQMSDNRSAWIHVPCGSRTVDVLDRQLCFIKTVRIKYRQFGEDYTCFVCCLASMIKEMGLRARAAKIFVQGRVVPSGRHPHEYVHRVVNTVLKGKYQLMRTTKTNRFHPYVDGCDTLPIVAYLKERDSQYPHCIGFYKGMIFDPSLPNAIYRTRTNLDHLCGGVGKFEGVHWAKRLVASSPA